MCGNETLESAVLTDLSDKVEPITVRDVLSGMSVAELLDAKGTVEMMLKSQVTKENDAIRASIEAIAKATGVPFERVLETLTPEKPRRTRIKRDEDTEKKPDRIKYRHPDNPELTWVGRGREPKWLEEARNEGYAEADLLAG